MLYTTTLVSSVQKTTEDRTIPPTTSTEDLKQACHLLPHPSNSDSQNVSNTQFSGHPPLLSSYRNIFPHHYVAMLKFHVTTQFPSPTLTDKTHPPSPTSEFSMVMINTHGWNGAHWIHLAQNAVK
jgi:hypothetical protein